MMALEPTTMALGVAMTLIPHRETLPDIEVTERAEDSDSQ